MRIEFKDKGNEAHLVITSRFWLRWRHFPAVDAALMAFPCAVWRTERKGLFTRRTIIYGPILPMMRAHSAAWRELNK